MQSPPAGFNPNQSLLPDVTASITPAMGGGAMKGGGTSDFLQKLIPQLKEVTYKVGMVEKTVPINREE